MLSFFRRLSKSKVGTCVMALILIAHPRRLRDRRHLQFRRRANRLRDGQLDPGQGRRPGSHRARDERRDAAPAAGSPAAEARSRLCDHRRRFRSACSTQLIDQRALIAFADKYGFPFVEAAGRCRDRPDSRRQGTQRQVQRAGLPAIPVAAAADRSGGPPDHHRQPAAAPAADAGRDQCRGCRSAWRRPMPRCCSKRARAKPRSSRSTRSGGPQSDRCRPPAIL